MKKLLWFAFLAFLFTSCKKEQNSSNEEKFKNQLNHVATLKFKGKTSEEEFNDKNILKFKNFEEAYKYFNAAKIEKKTLRINLNEKKIKSNSIEIKRTSGSEFKSYNNSGNFDVSISSSFVYPSSNVSLFIDVNMMVEYAVDNSYGFNVYTAAQLASTNFNTIYSNSSGFSVSSASTSGSNSFMIYLGGSVVIGGTTYSTLALIDGQVYITPDDPLPTSYNPPYSVTALIILSGYYV